MSAYLKLDRIFFQRQHQGMLNQLLAMRMMKGRFWMDPQVQFGGQSAIDPTECYYRGDSFEVVPESGTTREYPVLSPLDRAATKGWRSEKPLIEPRPRPHERNTRRRPR